MKCIYCYILFVHFPFSRAFIDFTSRNLIDKINNVTKEREFRRALDCFFRGYFVNHETGEVRCLLNISTSSFFLNGLQILAVNPYSFGFAMTGSSA